MKSLILMDEYRGYSLCLKNFEIYHIRGNLHRILFSHLRKLTQITSRVSRMQKMIMKLSLCFNVRNFEIPRTQQVSRKGIYIYSSLKTYFL